MLNKAPWAPPVVELAVRPIQRPDNNPSTNARAPHRGSIRANHPVIHPISSSNCPRHRLDYATAGTREPSLDLSGV